MELLSTDELNKLLTPLGGDNPCGDNLEYDETYMSLEELAVGSSSSEMGDSVISGKDPDYHKLYTSCLSLWDRTRDLYVASFFTLASTKMFGLEGLKQGLQVIDYLVKDLYDTFYPELDPDDDNDPTQRINILAMISPADGAFSDGYNFFNILREIRLVPELDYTYRDYLIASGYIESADDEVDINVLTTQMATIPQKSLTDKLALVESIQELVKNIADNFNQKTNDLGYLSFESLEHEIKLLHNLYKNFVANNSNTSGDTTTDSTATEEQSQDTAPVQSVVAATATVAPQVVVKSVFNLDTYKAQSRSDALILIKKASEYFEKTEPTSPVPYLLQRALRMANMNFIDLLGEIDSNALDRGREQLGVKKPDDGSSW